MTKKNIKISELSKKDQTKTLIALLKQQPDILQTEPKLLEILQFDNPKDGNITAIAGKQSSHLKEQLIEHQDRTRQLLVNAKRYDELTKNIYSMVNSLLICNSSEEVINAVIEQSPDLFDVDFIGIKGTLNLKDSKNLTAYFSSKIKKEEAYTHVMERMAQGKCLCSDRFPESVLNFFFGDDAQDIKSVAFVPLINSSDDPKKAFGALALGSKIKAKFSSKLKGTIHLERLGKVTALTLERISKNA